MRNGLHLAGVQLSGLQADAAHPNKMKFSGILVRLDEASSKPPNGAAGHRIFVPTAVAKRRLGSLIGMGLNYSNDLDTHDQKRKVGVISKAWIDGKDLRVEGHIWKHDFPEAEKDLKQTGLGMSMELGDVRVENPRADVWTLDDFQFLGATILWRDSAAYTRTQAIAARAEQRRGSMPTKTSSREGTRTARKSSEERMVEIAATAASGAVKSSTRKLLHVLKSQSDALASIAASQEDLASRVGALEASDTIEAKKSAATSTSSSSTSSEDELYSEAGDASSSSEEEMSSSKAKTSSSSSSEGEMDSAVDTGDLEENEKDEDNAGHANEDATNRGEDGADDLIKKVGKTVESAKIKVLRKALKAANERNAGLEASVRNLTKKVDKLGTQVTAAAKDTGRRSLAPEITAMLSKANIEAGDLLRTGTKLSVAEVDGILASSGLNLAPQDRVSMKNAFLSCGLMDEGRVER